MSNINYRKYYRIVTWAAKRYADDTTPLMLNERYLAVASAAMVKYT